MNKRVIAITLVLAGVALSASIAPARLGEYAKPLSVKEWVNGDPVDMSKNSGSHVYVVEFWATWCPPCRQSIPHLSELQKKYKDDRLVIVGVTDQDSEDVRSFIKNFDPKVEYAVAIDDNEQSTQSRYLAEYGIDYIPAAFVVNRDGRIAWYGNPLDPGFENALKRAIVAKPISGTESANSESSGVKRDKS